MEEEEAAAEASNGGRGDTRDRGASDARERCRGILPDLSRPGSFPLGWRRWGRGGELGARRMISTRGELEKPTPDTLRLCQTSP